MVDVPFMIRRWFIDFQVFGILYGLKVISCFIGICGIGGYDPRLLRVSTYIHAIAVLMLIQ